MHRSFLLLFVIASLHAADDARYTTAYGPAEALVLPSRNMAAKRMVLPEDDFAYDFTDVKKYPDFKTRIVEFPELMQLLDEDAKLMAQINTLVGENVEREEELKMLVNQPRPLTPEDDARWVKLYTELERTDAEIIELKKKHVHNKRVLNFEARKLGFYDVQKRFVRPRADNDNEIRSIRRRRDASPRRR